MGRDLFISFIIIGRNEGLKLEKCINSILLSVNYNKINNYEIIYVDSKSTDNSINIVQSFGFVKCLLITDLYNAAIARNIGAKEAIGEYLFFIDGDMEILPDFLGNILKQEHRIKSTCFTGHLDDVFYDAKGNLIGSYPRTYKKSIPSEEKILTTNGGIFFLSKHNWNIVNGMRTKYRRCQDIDLTLRLSKKRIYTIQLPLKIALHHTIDYKNNDRIWEFLFNGSYNYLSVIYRDHFFNFKLLKNFLRAQYTAISLLFSLVLVFFTPLLLFFYLFILFIRVFFNYHKIKRTQNVTFTYYLQLLVYFILRDIIFWFSFLFFYPKSKNIQYVKL
jgi:glycosyltransferase involved in cell wall biosynthesis